MHKIVSTIKLPAKFEEYAAKQIAGFKYDENMNKYVSNHFYWNNKKGHVDIEKQPVSYYELVGVLTLFLASVGQGIEFTRRDPLLSLIDRVEEVCK
jgi:hypothetical protein